jgi:two-component system sensor histidine kinase DesK
MGLGSLRRYTWWSLTGTTAFFLVVLIGAWILDPAVPVWARVASTVALAVTVVASAVLFTRRLAFVPVGRPDVQPSRLPVAWMIAGSVGAAVLGGILLAMRDDELWSLPPAVMVSIVATFLPPRTRWVLIAVSAASAAALGGIAGLAWGSGLGRAVLFPPGMIVSVAWVTLGMLWTWDVAERLDEARRLAGQLAVAEERLRFAADLHDIQGHHLQVIARKSELAARLAQADPARAAAEMLQVQRLSTDALHDTRAVVHGYRRTRLEEEIANTAKVLAAADIEVRMHIEPTAVADTDRLSTASRHLLGLVMREATTNVLRHSQARHADVDYQLTNGTAWLRVRNDGATDPPGPATGTGLCTLAQRVEAAGGELTWEHDHDRFVVAASLPVDARPQDASTVGKEVR